MTTPSGAAKAYANLARLTDPTAALPRPAGRVAGGEPNFSTALKEAMTAVAEAGKKSDLQAKALAAGKANVVDVVTAVAETEVAIDALVAVRDRVIQSYEEIMRMPI
ncbi:MAG: flagellar hook-basal body complex protein FliE [Pseudorhodoplanes sp.]|nr:Flagellar hook-basal body complex protein FliE [Pseudorhodoplanes sp.]MCL4711404.1 flagellar hook-basal body complex protein FliE [Pseudorhodoplanes sp.]MCQ3942398.1 flagellar hook-basal body complex protein FliE [Alphaproteobacteria bacterium]GIK79193.1 MAG: flagellar hook-basal body complex protein FliE 1 [Alphaproteobacteria bacterium]